MDEPAQPTAAPTIRYMHPLRPSPWRRGSAWVPAGQRADVAGKVLVDGLFYLGKAILSQSGTIEPALIDPGLPLDREAPDWDGEDLEPWPTFATLTPASRAAYLTWLADGRCHQRAPTGYVLLFFYGLERRVLVDILLSGAPPAELPIIAAEIRRLLGIYGHDERFHAPAHQLLDLIAASGPDPADAPPPYGREERWPVPLALRAGLGRFAVGGRPVPAAWALSWAWYHPSILPRTAQTRCATEFRRLFAIRYDERYGDGLVVNPRHQPVRLDYQPTSSGLLTFDHDLLGVPDVMEDPDANQILAALVNHVVAELDAFNRYVGLYPENRHSLAAQALLPADLVSDTEGPAAPLLAWARTTLGRDASVVVDAADLIRFWPTADATMSSADVVTCAQLLERHGIGLEPDPRLGGPVLSEGPAVLFEARGDMPRAAGTEYAVATTMLQLAVAVGGVDGELLAAEHDVMLENLRTALELTPAEIERLTAHLHWLSVTGATLSDLGPRLAGLPRPRRDAIAEVLVAVAASDGVISPDEVEILIKIFGMLELSTDTLYSRLHAHSVDVPAVPRPREAEQPHHAPAPWPPAPAAQVAVAPGVVALDARVLAASAAMTAAVATLLGEIFADDDEDPEPESVEPDVGNEAVEGLDAAHARLLIDVLGRPGWSQAEFADLADRAGLMPIGALDSLNDYAMDLCGDVLLEADGDDLVLNDFATEAINR